MNSTAESLVSHRVAGSPASGASRDRIRKKSATPRPKPVLGPWLRAQSINVTRHAAALRPFRREEFGGGAAAPSEGHLQVVNQLITGLRRGLLKMSENVHRSIAKATDRPSTRRLQRVVTHKDKAHRWVQGIEKIWD